MVMTNGQVSEVTPLYLYHDRAVAGLASAGMTGACVTSIIVRREFTNDERTYTYARLVLTVLLTLLSLEVVTVPLGPLRAVYFLALAILVVDGIALGLIIHFTRAEPTRAMLWVLFPDLVAIALFSYVFFGLADAFYPVCVLIATTYALVLERRSAYLSTVAIAFAYSVGLVPAQTLDAAHVLIFALKSLSIIAIGVVVANSVSKQRSREEEAQAGAEEKEYLNEQLRRRVAELQAVSEITEIIHSSLDFDRVGPVVLDIVSKAIGVDSCCLFVIDKQKSETLFSASVGTLAPLASSVSPSGLEVGSESTPFSCAPVFDHLNMMVLFCASADAMESLTDEDRLVIGAVASELVVAVENSRLYKLTKRLAITDELTGLSNYRHLQQRLDEELGRATRYSKNVSLLMLDADDFKNFNDTHGHLAGDVALAEFGDLLRGGVREVDLAARYGGEEFSVVLPETDAAGAYIVAEKIRESIARHAFADENGERNCAITVSIGVATYPTHAWDKESLLREADDALYNAKSGGKNRVKTPVRTSGDQETIGA